MMKKVYSYLQKVPGILLILYVQLIIDADIFQTAYSDRTKGWLYFLTFLLSVLICPALIRLTRRFSVRYKAVLTTRKKKALWFIGFLLLSAAVFGVYYAAYYPGAFSADSITQYRQAVTGQYNNWHPVLHTLLGFTLPLTVTGGWVGSIVLFQLIAFSLAAAYAAYTVLRHSNIPYAVISLVLVLISPATARISLYPWKDVPFAVLALLAAAYAANAYFTKGAWLKKRSHLIAAAAVLVIATVFRHNALLFTLPMLIAMLLYLNRRTAVIAGACFLAAIILIEGPLYALLKVEQPGDRAEEMLGVPVSVIGGVAARNPQALDDDIKTFIYAVAPAETWENNYLFGNFNTVKFSYGANYHKISEEGAPKVIGYMLRCFVKSPKEAFSALFAATDMVYTITGDDSHWSDVFPYIVSNEYGIADHGNRDLRDAAAYVTDHLYLFGKWVFWYLGTMNLLLITAILSKLRLRGKAAWSRFLILMSMLLYNFGTMLLLSGDDFRLFYYTVPVLPVMLLIALREDRETFAEASDPRLPAQEEPSVSRDMSGDNAAGSADGGVPAAVPVSDGSVLSE